MIKSAVSSASHDRPQAAINLHRGWPNPSLLPTALIQKAASATFADPQTFIPGLLYGPNLGDARLREEIAKWLTDYFAPDEAITLARIVITGGASQNWATLMQIYSDPSYTLNVWFVVPCYMLACRAMEDAGFAGRLRSVPEDDEGVDVAYLEVELQKAEEEALHLTKDSNVVPTFKSKRLYRKSYRHVIFAVPTFANPSGRIMTLKRRKQLVALARRFDALIICDDVYDFLQWSVDPAAAMTGRRDRAAVPRLVDVDRFLDGGTERPGADGYGNVASNGTFSKIAAPGLRTGWTEATERFTFGLSEAGTTVSGGAPSHFNAVLLASLLSSGDLQRYILEELQSRYAQRYHVLHAAIKQHLVPLGCSFAVKTSESELVGGYFIWLCLPPGLDGRSVMIRAQEEENLVVAPGNIFEVPGDDRRDGTHFESYVRLCFAWEEEENLLLGVERLANTIQRMLYA